MVATIHSLPPGSLLMLGALLAPLIRGRAQQGWLLSLPVLSYLHLLSFPDGYLLTFTFFDYVLVPIRVDALSMVWGTIFHLAAFLGVIYALHVRENVQNVSALLYVGAAITAVFAGDLITLFVFWEITAVTSVFLIWASRTEPAYRAGMRYLVIQVGSGVCLLAGALLHSHDTGSIAFDHLGLQSPGTWLIFIAFGIKCAFPLLHNWLQDAYPEATVTGTVFLSSFTTKLAVYALARGFAGTEILIPIGAVMTAYPIFYAVIENDLRRVLAYSLNNQLGFMVVGIGIGTELSLNGTAAHAFTHILYKSLLFMSMGAVLFRAGTIKGSELGGLYRSMPLTMLFCVVGAASISAFPLMSGFVSKSLIISAAAEGHHTLTFLVLIFASAGVFHHSGIKIPYFAFFSHDAGIRAKEAPVHMLVAMGITAALCIGIGIYPKPLYDLLPYAVEYQPYTVAHVITQLQLLLYAAVCFGFLKLVRLYPPELSSVNLDTDWVYRRILPQAYRGIRHGASQSFALSSIFVREQLSRAIDGVYNSAGPYGLFARTWPTGNTVLWVSLILSAFLLAYYTR